MKFLWSYFKKNYCIKIFTPNYGVCNSQLSLFLWKMALPRYFFLLILSINYVFHLLQRWNLNPAVFQLLIPFSNIFFHTIHTGKRKTFPQNYLLHFSSSLTQRLALQSRTAVLIPFFNVLRYRCKDLSPFLGAILHLNGCNAAEKLFWCYIFRQFGKKLCYMNKVHL